MQSCITLFTPAQIRLPKPDYSSLIRHLCLGTNEPLFGHISIALSGSLKDSAANKRINAYQHDATCISAGHSKSKLAAHTDDIIMSCLVANCNTTFVLPKPFSVYDVYISVDRNPRPAHASFPLWPVL